MSSKPLAESDRQMFPAVDFVANEIGQDAVGIIVRREVYDAGVKNLTKDQARALFEGKVRNWADWAGRRGVFVYDKEPGRPREAIDKYLYGTGKAPPPPSQTPTPSSVATRRSAPSCCPRRGRSGRCRRRSSSAIPSWPSSPSTASSLPENVRALRYPLSRPLYLVTDGPPAGAAKTFVDYVLSGPGQQLVNKHGYLNLTDLGLS